MRWRHWPKADDTEDAREQAGILSAALVPKLLETGLPGVQGFVCSMKEKRWVQRGSTAANPYRGKAMATCGTPMKGPEAGTHTPECPHLANTFLAIGAALLLGGPPFAQQEQQQKPSTMQEKPQMSMGDMMKGCREHCQQTSASIDSLMQRMEEAEQSNDPTKMRAALDEAQKPLAEMKQYMSMCMSMMGMMQKMHGMGGMMGKGGTMSPERQPVSDKTEQRYDLDITLTSQPDPPRSGENTFEMIVRGVDGEPVTDANVL